MIVQEHFTQFGREFTRTYSDEGRYVVRDGVEYGEAEDPAEFDRQYTEGDIMPDDSEPEELLDIILGGAE